MTNAEVAKAWRAEVVSSRQWRRAPNQAGVIEGEATGFFVKTAGFGRRAYLKPAKDHPDSARHRRAAREKIASDLACDLGLPVPPAVLWNRPSVEGGEQRAVVLTLVMFPRQWPWQMVRTRAMDDTVYGTALAKALWGCSPMWVFDTPTPSAAAENGTAVAGIR